MRRPIALLSTLISSAASTLATIGLLIGLPLALITFVGKPWPSPIPSLDTIQWHISSGYVPDAFWIGLLSLVLWFVWAQLVAGFVVEVVAAARGISAPSLPAVALGQHLMGPLVARFAMVFTVLGTSPGIASAATMPSTIEVPDAVPAMASTITSSFAMAGASMNATVDSFGQIVDQPDIAAQQTAVAETVEVRRRETFRSLAQTHLGSADQWAVLRNANIGNTMIDGTEIGASTVTIKAGWTLTLPAGVSAAGGSETPQTLPAATTGADSVGLDSADSVGLDSADSVGLDSADSVGLGGVDIDDGAVVGTVDVQEGDHFWLLAETTLTNAWGRPPTDAELTPYWGEMVLANADSLLPPDDPNLIYPGQTFVIPPVPANPDMGPSAEMSADAPLSDRVEQDPALPPVASVESAPVTEAPTPVEETAPPVGPVAAAISSETSTSDLDDLLASDLARKALLATVGGFTLALAGITLSRLRRRRIAARTPNTIVTPDALNIAAIEDQVRALSLDGEAARYVAAFNPWLSHILEPGHTVPALIALKAGTNGVELLLDEPADLGQKFICTNDTATAWRLTSDVTDRQMEKDAANAIPFAPMLLPVGDTPSGELLVDFEQLGAVSVIGDQTGRNGLLRNIVVNALASPWFNDVEIVAIGVPGVRPTPDSRIVVPNDPQQWAERVVAEAMRDAADTSRSAYEDRIDGLIGEQTARLVVVGAGYAGIAQHLATGAEQAYSRLAVVSGSELATEHQLTVDGKIGTLEPMRLRFDVDLVEEIDLVDMDQLMTAAQAQEASTGQPVEPIAPTKPAKPALASEAALTRIAEITKPCGVEVKVLSDTPTVTGAELSGKPAAVFAYVVLNPDVDAAKTRTLFWEDDKSQSAYNTFNKLRKALGEGPDGVPRLPKGNTLTTTDVGSDWGRFGLLVEAANTASTSADEAAFLDAALEQVEGQPALNANPALWAWFRDEREWYETVTTLIVEAAARRAALALKVGDAVAARHAVRQGQRVCKTSETLLMHSLNATKLIEGDREVDAEFADALAEAEACGYDLTPETHRFYSDVRNKPVLNMVGAAPTSSSSPEPTPVWADPETTETT